MSAEHRQPTWRSGRPTGTHEPTSGESGSDDLATAAEVALSRARDLLSWWNSVQNLSLFDLEPATESVTIRGFFETLNLEGKRTSAMGVLQTSDFRRGTPLAPGRLGEWVGRDFLRGACWTTPAGASGGFRYTLHLLKEFDRSARAPIEGEELTLADIGVRYESAVLRVDLLDFARAFPDALRLFGLVDRFSRESAYVVCHDMFSSWSPPTPAGAHVEACFGYCFAPVQIHRSIQGYGPGRFYSALKQYRFLRLPEGDVRVEVSFVSAPRTEKILDILGVDPVYGTAAMFDGVTQRRASPWAHTFMDRFALRHHGRVHRNLLEGMRHIWEGRV